MPPIRVGQLVLQLCFVCPPAFTGFGFGIGMRVFAFLVTVDSGEGEGAMQELATIYCSFIGARYGRIREGGREAERQLRQVSHTAVRLLKLCLEAETTLIDLAALHKSN